MPMDEKFRKAKSRKLDPLHVSICDLTFPSSSAEASKDVHIAFQRAPRETIQVHKVPRQSWAHQCAALTPFLAFLSSYPIKALHLPPIWHQAYTEPACA